MVRHRGGLFERAAVLEVRRYPRRPKRMVADLRLDVPTPADARGCCRRSAMAGIGEALVPDSLSRHMRASARRRTGLAAAI